MTRTALLLLATIAFTTTISAADDQPKSWRLDEYRRSPEYYREQYRPAYHFTPELNWMNDPNGLVYLDGEYHLFYQHNPLETKWGHMSWGHAVSTDLLHWQHLPIALYEEYGVMIFSGSAVVDERNTSGFGKDNKPPLVAIYTGHGHGRQTQDIAFSTDRGRTWTKYDGNPVIDLHEAEFRDPKVFWHEPTRQWVMVVALSARKQVQFYGSPDLKKWTLLSEFGPVGVENKPNWECPDMFELPIANEPGKTRWVLVANMGGGSITGGMGVEYFTGTFDGKIFTSDSTKSQWADYGRDFYAVSSWSNIADRRIWIGWMANGDIGLTPTHPWRSNMSVPRELLLCRINGTLRLCQTPVRELQKLRDKSIQLSDTTLNSEPIPLDLRTQQCEIHVEFDPGTAADFGLRVLKKNDQQTIVGYDVKSKSVYVDRTKSGNVSFHPGFAGRHAGPLEPDAAGRIRLHVLTDACSVEVFANDGQTVISDLVFPDPDANTLEVFATGGNARLVKCEAHALNPVWKYNK